MKVEPALKENESRKEKIFADRARTNILREGEQSLIFYLLKKTPVWIKPNGMTFIGMIGSLIVFLSFLAAHFITVNWLLLGLAGLFINWIGDSLDGRLAYFRGIPRKWYGFSLDIIMDWLSIILIGLGYYFYAPIATKVFSFLFVVLYGWSMIISLLRYKITGHYQIDSGKLGPTELRVIVSIILLLETIFPGSIGYLAAAIVALLFIINLSDTAKLLKAGNIRDRDEQKYN